MNSTDIHLVEDCRKYARSILAQYSRPTTDDITRISIREYQGQFLFIQLHAALEVYNEYWAIRSLGAVHSCRMVARHIYERLLVSSASREPSDAVGIVLYEIKKLQTDSRRNKDNSQSEPERKAWAKRLQELEEEYSQIQRLCPSAPIKWGPEELRKKSEEPQCDYIYSRLSKFVHATYSDYFPLDQPEVPNIADTAVLEALVATAHNLLNWMNDGATDCKTCDDLIIRIAQFWCDASTEKIPGAIVPEGMMGAINKIPQ